MARVAVLLTTAAALAGWAGAQGPPPPLAPADRLALFRANRTLLDNLVSDGVALSDATDPLRRAEGCRKTVRTLVNSLGRAATEDRNPDRVAELADLVGEVVRDGLAPNLAEAAATTPPDSPEAKRLREVRDKAAADLDEVGAVVPAAPVGAHPQVQTALEKLAALRAKLK
ncbi:MAG: hypothetical protein C0501_17395 [Isosphaera sp.]|nr:hypothetical protein [Isosphaera sp.]